MRKGRVLCTVLIGVALFPSLAIAQDEAGVPVSENPNVFLERSYISPFMPTGKDLILEGQASTHFWIWNTLTDATWRRDGGWKWFNVPVTMTFVVRIFDDFSSPVRTPSFILRPLYWQAFHLKRDRDEDGGSFRLIGLGLGATHHSDGQAGCTFQGQSYDVELDDCATTDPALYAERRANTVNGSFSSNFFQLDLGLRKGRLDNNARVVKQVSVRLKGEWHPLDMATGGLSEELAEQYGQGLFGVAIEGERAFPKGTGRLELYNQWRFGGVKDGSDYAGQIEASWLFRRAENFGVFARLHWGSDYYNIHFQNTDTFFQAGLMWDPGRLDQFVRRRRR